MKRYVYVNDDDSLKELYCDNRISNRKYTIVNFLPKNLWEQFSRFMNQYFLLIACLQLWSLITPVNPASTWGPLIFIFAVSATKEAWDDYNRYLSDKKANEKEVWVVRHGIKKHAVGPDGLTKTSSHGYPEIVSSELFKVSQALFLTYMICVIEAVNHVTVHVTVGPYFGFYEYMLGQPVFMSLLFDVVVFIVSLWSLLVEAFRGVSWKISKAIELCPFLSVVPCIGNLIQRFSLTLPIVLIQAQDIHVGNLVWLHENDEVPCDLVLLGTSDPQGLCYVETAALDGETDLKTRVIPAACGVIECPSPDKDIRRFDANLRLFPPFIDNDICPLTIQNTLLQSCYLRNAQWACGVAVYTGKKAIVLVLKILFWGQFYRVLLLTRIWHVESHGFSIVHFAFYLFVLLEGQWLLYTLGGGAWIGIQAMDIGCENEPFVCFSLSKEVDKVFCPVLDILEYEIFTRTRLECNLEREDHACHIMPILVRYVLFTRLTRLHKLVG
ncbi:P-type ATPase, N-terminal [Dillenia turbinata]|uniref:P-type ATPase, N-terminal n=1 Tax=Dillenia turbinata TaxID=194707 RepID=A0AAN8V1E2_9MAGN